MQILIIQVGNLHEIQLNIVGEMNNVCTISNTINEAMVRSPKD